MNPTIRVLIVDDEESQRSGLAAMVSAWGMTPKTAGNGEEALGELESFAAECPDGLEYAVLDGFGFLERLREQARYADNHPDCLWHRERR